MNIYMDIPSPAVKQAGQTAALYGIQNHGLNNLRNVYWNLPSCALYEEAVFRGEGIIGHDGPFGPQLGMTPFNDVRFGLLGGSIVDANALLRAYIWHCVAIPIIASLFMVVHFWRVRKDGGISGPSPVMLESEIKEPRKI